MRKQCDTFFEKIGFAKIAVRLQLNVKVTSPLVSNDGKLDVIKVVKAVSEVYQAIK